MEEMTEKCVLIESLEQIKLADWVEMEVTRDLTKLIISGEPTADQLADAWVALQSRYLQLVNKEQAETYRSDTSDAESLKMKLRTVPTLVYGGRLILSNQEDAECTALTGDILEQLREWGFGIDELTEEGLERVELQLKQDEVQLEMVLATADDTKKVADERTVSKAREEYTEMLLQVEEHRKVVYNLEDVTVFKFAVMYGQLREYANYIKNLNKKD